MAAIPPLPAHCSFSLACLLLAGSMAPCLADHATTPPHLTLNPQQIVQSYIHGSHQERKTALEQIIQLKARAIPALVQAYEDADPGHRAGAISGITHLPPHMKAFPTLTLALHDESPVVRTKAAETLGHYGQPGFVALSLLCADPNYDPLITLAGLRQFRHPFVTAFVARQADHPEFRVRESVYTILGEYAEDPAIPPLLLKGLADKNTWIRKWALHSISTAGPLMITHLLAALNQPNQHLHLEVVDALGGIRDPRAVPALIQAEKHADPDVRIAALENLASFHTPEVAPALLAACDDPHAGVRAQAFLSLREFSSPETRDRATRALQDPDPAVRKAAQKLISYLLMH